MEKIRFAVLGLGHIAQIAVLPAFKHANEKCELTGFISDDPEKIEKLSKEYKVENSWTYAEFDKALKSKTFDALYVALPNDMHKEFVIRAANAGIHVLCEKPMAITSGDCQEMIDAAAKNKVKLMIAYRLHFEECNMQAVDIIHKGIIGQPKFFNSTFTLQVREGNIRTQSEHGGGPLNDIGIYCINAARYLFREEPHAVLASTVKSSDPRFAEIEETLCATMFFSNAKIASFVCSFGAFQVQRFEVVGTDGVIAMDPAYEYSEGLKYTLKTKDKETEHSVPKRDQFAPELLHFAQCILENKDPRPSGEEGFNDLKVIEAIRESCKTGQIVKIEGSSEKSSKPDAELIEKKPGVSKPELVNVQSGSKN